MLIFKIFMGIGCPKITWAVQSGQDPEILSTKVLKATEKPIFAPSF
jgi:hypothetical protein